MVDLLRYDPDTGIFTWAVDASIGMRKGSVAGGKDAAGYVVISINRKKIKAARIAWRIMTGEWPTSDIDHKDGDRGNNRWANLRLATESQNGANARLSRRNTSGFKGVSYSKQKQKWTAQIRVSGRLHYLGAFSSPEQASAAYREAAVRRFGEFARV